MTARIAIRILSQVRDYELFSRLIFMEDLKKINSYQFFQFWKNLSISLLVMIAVIFLSRIFPHYYSPIIALFAAGFLYARLYNAKFSRNVTCMVLTYSTFFCIIAYSIVGIVINLLDIWGIIKIPRELSFFNEPFIPTLILIPVSFVVMLVLYILGDRIQICRTCKMKHGMSMNTNKLTTLLSSESRLQVRNLMVLFGVLAVIMWVYFLFFYINTDVNGRDSYVFVWLCIGVFAIDEIYIVIRYYNLYLDLKDNDEIITPDELSDMSAKTYLRYYVVCDENMYLTKGGLNPETMKRDLIDTPFFTKRSVNNLTFPEVEKIIEDMSGVEGSLRFFFGRKLPDMKKHSVLRYFYFLKGIPEDYPELDEPGLWVSFKKVKEIYSYHPSKMSPILVADLTRLATIILTEKTFDEDGFRKMGLKNYQPSFTLKDVEESNLDFQDDKWIHVSMFNSDTSFYKLKKWWREHGTRKKKDKTLWR